MLSLALLSLGWLWGPPDGIAELLSEVWRWNGCEVSHWTPVGGLRNSPHSSLSTHHLFSPFFPSFRQKLVVFPGVVEDWLKRIRTQHPLSPLWTLGWGFGASKQEPFSSKVGMGCFSCGASALSCQWGSLFYSAPLLATRNSFFFFKTEKKKIPNQMYRALGVGYKKNVFRHLKEKKNQCIYLTSFRVSKAHFNFLICLFFFCSIFG